MKFYRRLLAVVFFICSVSHTTLAQQTGDYTVYHMEEIIRSFENDNPAEVMASKSFVFSEDDADEENGIYLFKKGSEKLYIRQNDDNEIIKLTLITQTTKLQRLISSLTADSRYSRSSETRWTYGRCTYIVRMTDNTFELHRPAGVSLPPVVTAPKAPATTPAKPYNPGSSVMSNTRFPDIQTFIKIMNRSMQKAVIDENNPTPPHLVGKSYSKPNIDYKFKLLGKTDRVNSSLEFIEKYGKLYLRIFLPKEGNCVSGLFDIEAVDGRVRGWGDEVFGIMGFKYDRTCGGNIYNTIEVNIYHNNDKEMSVDVNDWLKANTP